VAETKLTLGQQEMNSDAKIGCSQYKLFHSVPHTKTQDLEENKNMNIPITPAAVVVHQQTTTTANHQRPALPLTGFTRSRG